MASCQSTGSLPRGGTRHGVLFSTGCETTADSTCNRRPRWWKTPTSRHHRRPQRLGHAPRPQVLERPRTLQSRSLRRFPSPGVEYAASGEWDKRDHYGYGAGRRICPGTHLAERNLFIGVAKIFWAFEYTEPPGSQSDISAESGASHSPKDYGCGVRLRSYMRS